MKRINSYELKVSISPVRLILSTSPFSTFSFSFSSSCGPNWTVSAVKCQKCNMIYICIKTCCVVARQYSAVLRMLQMRQSSSVVNLATSKASFSFNRLLIVRPPLLLLVLQQNHKSSLYIKNK